MEGAESGFVAAWKWIRRNASTMFFFGGFIWDSVALHRGSKPWDLWLLLIYMCLSIVVLALIGREIKPKREEWFNWVLQFCFGGTLASLTVLYFISAASLPSLIFILFLAVVLVANEYLESRYGHMTVSLTMFAVGTMMYLNFAIPVVLKSVKPVWFYVSTALGLGLAFLLRRFAITDKVSFKPALVAGVVFVLLFLLKWIPPVPIVKREMIVCRELQRAPQTATAMVEAPPWWHFWKRSESTVHLRPGEKVYCYTAVFLPPGVETKIVHQWYYHDPNKGWTKDLRIVVPVRGGRDDGWRMWSYKWNFAAGDWRVYAETENGQVVAVGHFTVVPVPAGTAVDFKPIAMR